MKEKYKHNCYLLQLFLDDSVRNVAAGKEMGLHTVLVILQFVVLVINIEFNFL